jgi:hypothetical protein
MTDQFSAFSSGLEMTVVTRPLYQVSPKENVLTRGSSVKWDCSRLSIARLCCIIARRWSRCLGWGWGDLPAQFLKWFSHQPSFAFIREAAKLTIEAMDPQHSQDAAHFLF